MIIPVWTGKRYIFKVEARASRHRHESYEALHQDNVRLRVIVAELRSTNRRLRKEIADPE